MKELLRLSDELVAEILAADDIAIGTPVYNYNVPAVLKAYIDHIVRKGMTLGFSGEGLVHGKKCTILMASGGIYTEGSPIRDRDIATNYLRLILKVIGIENVTVVAGGNAKAVDMGQTTREEFLRKFDLEVTEAAKPDGLLVRPAGAGLVGRGHGGALGHDGGISATGVVPAVTVVGSALNER